MAGTVFVSCVWRECVDLALSLPRVINFKFPLQPHQNYYTTQYEELGFSYLTQMKDDYATNSHHLTHAWKNVLFELGNERVKRLKVY